MLKRIITDSICKEKYLELFENLSPLNKDFSIAHNPAIPSILEKTFGYKPKFISFYDEDELIGVIPACSVNGKFVSMPHFSYGGFVGKKQIDQSLIQTALSDFNKFEIRGMNKVSEFYSEDKLTAYLFLKDNEEGTIS